MMKAVRDEYALVIEKPTIAAMSDMARWPAANRGMTREAMRASARRARGPVMPCAALPQCLNV
jgi:hypothetical protein